MFGNDENPNVDEMLDDLLKGLPNNPQMPRLDAEVITGLMVQAAGPKFVVSMIQQVLVGLMHLNADQLRHMEKVFDRRDEDRDNFRPYEEDLLQAVISMIRIVRRQAEIHEAEGKN